MRTGTPRPGFGCRVLNADSCYQGCARRFLTVWRSWIASVCLRLPGCISDVFLPDTYIRWKDDIERQIDWQAGCCLSVRAEPPKGLGGFDEQLYYYHEAMDLYRRIWGSGYLIVYTPDVIITHLVCQSMKSFRVASELDKFRNRHRYFYKHFGRKGARRCRNATLAWLRIRMAGAGYELVGLVKLSETLKRRLELYSAAAIWNRRVDPVELVERGKEPDTDLGAPLDVPESTSCSLRLGGDDGNQS